MYVYSLKSHPSTSLGPYFAKEFVKNSLVQHLHGKDEEYFVRNIIIRTKVHVYIHVHIIVELFVSPNV
jgi:hypothetical protein